jgi:hypothetical protein
VLLVSTDPASNLDAVLEIPLGVEPTPVRGMRGLFALNIDPEQAARDDRERTVAPPHRGVLPPQEVTLLEERLSGACTVVEVAAFGEDKAEATISGTLQAGNEDMGAGEEISGVSSPFDGLIDEIRISTVVRPDAWLKATYRNLSAPTSFLYSGAGEQEGGGGPTPAPRSLSS